MTSIAAGNLPSGRFVGAAPESRLLIVKLGNADKVSFPRTTELMRAITYVVKKAQQLQLPVAVNISFGNTYGAHDGTSILERFLDNASEIGRSVFCVGSGNEGAAAGHTSGLLQSGETIQTELAVGQYQRPFGIQLWKNYVDEIRIELVSPEGESISVFMNAPGKQVLPVGECRILVYVGEPKPYTINQEIYFDFLPQRNYVQSGIWRIVLRGGRIVNGSYLFYLPSENVLSPETRFFAPASRMTLTIPSTAGKVITVGAYDVVYDAYADFSGRGYPDEGFLNGSRADFLESGQLVKPDIAAPGVNILVAGAGGSFQTVSGTSFATPFVTGAAALMMEWGIVHGNDRYLYGEKVKAYLRRGAKPLRGERVYPNDRVGYGALCVADSLPIG